MKGINRLFQDVVLNILLPILVTLMLVVFFIGDKKDASDEAFKINPGSITIEAVWDSVRDVDIDLWVQGPVSNSPVGFNHLRGEQFSLLRDDLGYDWNVNAPFQRNYELTSAISLQPGNYVVNVHLYNVKRDKPPITVFVQIKYSNDTKHMVRHLWSGYVTLERPWEEATVVQFTIGDDLKLADINEETGICLKTC